MANTTAIAAATVRILPIPLHPLGQQGSIRLKHTINLDPDAVLNALAIPTAEIRAAVGRDDDAVQGKANGPGTFRSIRSRHPDNSTLPFGKAV
jgi:hypothetical protein